MARRLVLLAAWLLLPFAAQAITWEFDEPGNSQGWLAREGTNLTDRAFLRSEVADGVLRIFPAPFEAGRNPSLELISPLINHDSALFDRVIVRIRVVYNRPLSGGFGLAWTNSTNRTTPGREPDPAFRDPPRFEIGVPSPITTEWQEYAFGDLRKGAERDFGGEFQRICWEGQLIDIQIRMGLAVLPSGQRTIQRPEEMVAAVEIDRITLTGVEEQLQGELPPPVSSPASFGALFAPPFFAGMGQRGIGAVGYSQIPGVLGDVDGDQDVDLVALWAEDNFDGRDMPDKFRGWMEVLHVGAETLGHPRSSNLPQAFKYAIDGRDLDHDGRLEVLLGSVIQTQVLARDEEEGWRAMQELPQGLWPLGLGDADGDGYADVWMQAYLQEGEVLVFPNDRKGQFDPLRRLSLAPPKPGFSPFGLVEHVPQEQKVGLLWAPPYDDLGQGYEVDYWDGRGEVVREHLAVDVPFEMIRYAGDFDQDGDVDLIVSTELIEGDSARYRGLSFLVNRGDGVMEAVPWNDAVELVHAARFVDLNQDGLLDLVVVDGNIRSPAVLVGLGVRGGLPVLEGRYPIAGRGGPVLSGDVEGDGDVDLVVLEGSGYESGGVHVLRNQLDKVTAVIEAVDTTPAVFRLGRNYPNPFNPQTWIPLAVPGDDQSVQLRIYNVLGQPVRTLVDGRLTPGPHLVPWDGRDSRGQVVSSGVYLYRLEAGAWNAAGRMVKSE